MQETRSDNPLNSYPFSYISKNEFESIFKHVRRERRKRQDEKLWERFQMKKQEKRVNSSEAAAGPEDSEQDNSKAPLLNYGDLDACRYCPKSNAPAVACSAAQKFEPFPVCLSHHKGPDICLSPELQATSPSQLSPERPDCGCHHLGYMSTQCESPNELLSCPKVQHAEDNKLFEITNFDQEFKRVEELRDKIVFTLKSIENALDQNDFKSLDEEEMQRNRMRTAEFAARFKRNYHYQITRQVNEIRKLSSNESWKKSNFPASVKKFKSSHQVAVQALQTVEKHLRTTNDGSSNLWLQDFLSSVCEMEKLFSVVFHCDEEEEQIAIKTACSSIALQLDFIANKNKRNPEVRKKKKKHAVKRNEAKDNLWMYRTHKDWKTKAAELARAKLAKLNKKRTESCENDDRVDVKSILATHTPDNLPDLKMEVKQREGASLRKHNMRSVKEDHVRTMMEIVPDATDSDHEEEKAEVQLCKERIPSSPKMSLDQDNQAPADQIRPDIPPMDTAAKSKKVGPTNVGYICVKSEEETKPTNSSGSTFKIGTTKLPTMFWSISSDCGVEPTFPGALPLNGNVLGSSNGPLKLKKSPQLNLATKYRKALQGYQRKQKWYNPNIICSIDQMTDQIYEELIGSVASEINIDHIISKLIELELQT